MVRALVAFALCAHAAVALQLRAPSPVARGASAARRPRVLRSSEVDEAAPPPPTPSTPPAAPEGVTVVMEEDDGLTERQREIRRLKQAEKFVEQETGSHQCIICDFQYQPAKGCAGAAPGTDFEDLASGFRCPTCKCSKDKFQPVTADDRGLRREPGLRPAATP
ncbi:rubredoxin [Aureococcus anophagefferens]|uniref:Rubredoxin n=1 Tax=Aureococcus anophagefferens TaxID=44056 RepID=A0ABR1FIZ2_AURAN